MNPLPNIESTDSKRYIFLTGATGLVGQYLIYDLLQRNQRVAVLVRPNKKSSAESRLESIMQRWEKRVGKLLPRPIVISGDLKNEQLSVSEEQQLWVKLNCDRVIHNAAILQFHGQDRNAEPWVTNVDGTNHVLKFSADANIDEFHYVSTAYVSGICDSVFRESDFDNGQEFRNDYERSKFEAEKMVRDCDAFSSKTIFRPAVIVGDSKTGFTASYHGLYVYLRLMATLIPLQPPNRLGIRNTPIDLPMSGEEPRNLVPVDWVSEIICNVVCEPSAHNQTYHLVPDKGLTAKELIDACYEYFNSTGATFSESNEYVQTENDNEFAQKYLDNIKVYSSYDKSDPEFDGANVKSVFPDIACPEIDRESIFRFLDFGIQDNWGRKKDKIGPPEKWLDSQLQYILQALATLDVEGKPSSIGLNVFGPGGGQCQINMDAAESIEVTPGLPNNGAPILAICQDQLNRLNSNEEPIVVWRELLTRAINSDDSAKNRLQSIG